MSAPCPRFGFVVGIVPRASAAGARAKALVADLVELLEQHGLEAVRESGRSLVYVVTREGGQATHNDREFVRDWSQRWSEVASIAIGEITDVDRDA